jgi:uncharacterized protein YciI
MRVAYFYFMKQGPDRVRAVAPRHASYWHELALGRYRGGPFADKSGGLIVFDSASEEHAERLVSGDPFLREGLVNRHWIKEWLAEPDEGGEAAGETPDRARAEESPLASATWQAQATAE